MIKARLLGLSSSLQAILKTMVCCVLAVSLAFLPCCPASWGLLETLYLPELLAPRHLQMYFLLPLKYLTFFVGYLLKEPLLRHLCRYWASIESRVVRLQYEV